jgi:hypothetical protein
MRHENAGLFCLAKRVASALAAQAVPARGGFRRTLDRVSLVLITGTAKLFHIGPAGRRLRLVESLVDATSMGNAIVGYLSDDICRPEEREALLELTRQLAADLDKRRARLRALVCSASAKDEIEEPLEVGDAVIETADTEPTPAPPERAKAASGTKMAPARRQGPKTVPVTSSDVGAAAKNGHQTGVNGGSGG